MESNPESPFAMSGVDYAIPLPRAGRRYGPLPAILLCAPGLICWTLLAEMLSGRVVMSADMALLLILPLVVLALLTGISSIIIYIFLYLRTRPWCVILNPVVNIGGLRLVIGFFVFNTFMMQFFPE